MTDTSSEISLLPQVAEAALVAPGSGTGTATCTLAGRACNSAS